MNYPYEYLEEYRNGFYIIELEDYNSIPNGSDIKFEGVIEEKPIIKHLRSKKSPGVQLVRYFIETNLSVGGIKIKHEGPAFIRKGEKVTIWGKKHRDRFDALKIETDDVIIQIS